MKNVYSPSLNSDGKIIKEPDASGIAAPKARSLQLRGYVVVILGLILIFNSFTSVAQNCPTAGTHPFVNSENTYFPGTGTVTAGSTSIVLGVAGSGTNFGTADIAVGDIVLVIQMQGAQISVTTNPQATTYGSGSSGIPKGFTSTNLSAGLMEFAVAASAISHSAGGTLTIASGLTNSYSSTPYVPLSSPGQTGKYTYQVIRVPQYFNIQLSTNITAPKWNGSTGGVVVISAINQLDFNGKTVNALGAGFRGGGGPAMEVRIRYQL